MIVLEGSGRWRFLQFARDTFTLTELSLPNEAPSWGWNQTILIDRLGDWWMATRKGVVRFRGGAGLEQLVRARPAARYTKRDGLAADVVIRLFEDSRGDTPRGRCSARPGLLHVGKADRLSTTWPAGSPPRRRRKFLTRQFVPGPWTAAPF